MKRKLSFILIVLSLAMAFIGVAAANADSGQATLTIVNFVGKPLLFTLDDVHYTVPGTDTAPAGGRLDLTLNPGRHTYTADVPGTDAASGEVEAVSGQSIVLGVRLDHHEAIKDKEGVTIRNPYDFVVVFPASIPTANLPAATPLPTATSAPAAPAAVGPIPAGQGALVIDNYVGEDLHLDLNGKLYTVPADGRLQINLDPGVVSYSASVAASGLNGQAEIIAGQYTGLGFSRDFPVPTPTPDDEDKNKDKENTPIPLKLHVQPVTISAPAGGAPPASPTTVPPAKPESAMQPPVAGLKPGLTVTNFVGEPITFTINSQTYTIAANGGMLYIPLPGGEYAYTASTPSDSANGSFVLAGDQAREISVAYDFGNSRLKAYLK